jgi:hypothetical protein
MTDPVDHQRPPDPSAAPVPPVDGAATDAGIDQADEVDVLVSALIDGAATDNDEAWLAVDPHLARQRRAMSTAIAELRAVPEPPPGRLDEIVISALHAFDEERATVAGTSPGAASVTLTGAGVAPGDSAKDDGAGAVAIAAIRPVVPHPKPRESRARTRGVRRPWAAVAAVALLVVGVATMLLTLAGRPSSRTTDTAAAKAAEQGSTRSAAAGTRSPSAGDSTGNGPKDTNGPDDGRGPALADGVRPLSADSTSNSGPTAAAAPAAPAAGGLAPQGSAAADNGSAFVPSAGDATTTSSGPSGGTSGGASGGTAVGTPAGSPASADAGLGEFADGAALVRRVQGDPALRGAGTMAESAATTTTASNQSSGLRCVPPGERLLGGAVVAGRGVVVTLYATGGGAERLRAYDGATCTLVVDAALG